MLVIVSLSHNDLIIWDIFSLHSVLRCDSKPQCKHTDTSQFELGDKNTKISILCINNKKFPLFTTSCQETRQYEQIGLVSISQGLNIDPYKQAIFGWQNAPVYDYSQM